MEIIQDKTGLNRLHLRADIFFLTSLNHCFFTNSVLLKHYLALVFCVT